MKKIRSFSLFLALFLLFSFTSCNDKSGEITTENISTLNTEVIQSTTTETEDTTPETDAITVSEDIETDPGAETDTTSSPIIIIMPTVTTEPEGTTEPKPETTPEPEVTTVPEPETTPVPEVTTEPEPETTPEPEVTTVPEPETTPEPEVTTEPEPETTPEPEVTTEPETETTPEPEETTDPGYSEYDLAPDFIVFDANGKPVRLSDMRGKPVVLNFWASWCPPCKAEMPDFDKVSRELDGEVVFMMVNVWDTQAAAEAIIDSMGYTFPVYFDLLEDAVGKYGIESIPQTYFIDKWGGLAAYGVGALSEADLRYGISMIYN